MLQSITTAKSSEDIDILKHQVSEFVKNKNTQAKQHIDEFLNKKDNPNYQLVKVDVALFSGSIQFEDFISFKSEGNYQTLNTNTFVTAQQTHGGEIELLHQNTLSPHGQGVFLFYVPLSSVKISHNKLNIQTETVNIKNAEFRQDKETYIITP